MIRTPNMTITKDDGTIDFAKCTSAERMAYLDGWSDVRPSEADVAGRRRSSSDVEVENLDGTTRLERDRSVMRNAGHIERQLFDRGQL